MSNTKVAEPPHPPIPTGPGFCVQCGAELTEVARFCPRCGAPREGATPRPMPRDEATMDAIISLVVGLLLLYMNFRPWSWLSSRLFGTTFNEYRNPPGNGPIVSYLDQPDFWSDLGPALFTAALFVDAIVLLLLRNRMGIYIALAITGAATVFNIGYVIAAMTGMTASPGLPILSLLAALIGSFMSFRYLQAVRP